MITGWAGPRRGKEGGGGEPGGAGQRRRRGEGARGGGGGEGEEGVGNGGRAWRRRPSPKHTRAHPLQLLGPHTSRRRERPVFEIIFTDAEKGSHALLKMCLQGAPMTSHRSGLRNCPAQARNRIPLPQLPPPLPPRGSGSASLSLSLPTQGANAGTRLGASSGGKGRVTERRA